MNLLANIKVLIVGKRCSLHLKSSENIIGKLDADINHLTRVMDAELCRQQQNGLLLEWPKTPKKLLNYCQVKGRNILIPKEWKKKQAWWSNITKLILCSVRWCKYSMKNTKHCLLITKKMKLPKLLLLLSNMMLISLLVDSPADIYLLKFNNKSTRTRCEICSKLTIKIPTRRHRRRSGIFIVNFEHVSHLILVFIAGWVVIWPKRLKSIFIQIKNNEELQHDVINLC